MALDNEQLQILTMLKEDKISIAEAAELLEAIRTKPAKSVILRIKENEKEITNVLIPLRLARMAWKFIPRDLITEDIDPSEVLTVLEAGTEEMIIEINTPDENRSIEIGLK